MAEPTRVSQQTVFPWAGSLQKHPLQEIDLFRKCSVRGYQTLNLLYGVEDGCVVTAETAPDFRKRMRGQELGEIHGDLTWVHHSRRSPRGENIQRGLL